MAGIKQLLRGPSVLGEVAAIDRAGGGSHQSKGEGREQIFCKALDYFKKQKEALSKDDFEKLVKEKCTSMRQDGPFIEAGENDNLIVQRIEADPNAVGIFGYSFLYENADKLRGVKIAGIEPSFDTIADKSYGLSRPLFIYIKN